MRFLSDKECKQWCHNNHVEMDKHGHPNITAAKGAREFAIPADAGRRIALVKEHMSAFAKGKALVWITGWGIWPSSERYHIFERWRLSYGCNKNLAALPGQFFSAEEYEDMVSCVTLSVMFLWDCFVLVPFGKRALFYSHDEFGVEI